MCIWFSLLLCSAGGIRCHLRIKHFHFRLFVVVFSLFEQLNFTWFHTCMYKAYMQTIYCLWSIVRVVVVASFKFRFFLFHFCCHNNKFHSNQIYELSSEWTQNIDIERYAKIFSYVAREKKLPSQFFSNQFWVSHFFFNSLKLFDLIATDKNVDTHHTQVCILKW